MLLLVFRLGDDRFALDSGRIVEVLPLVSVKRALGAPAGIRGTFRYRGRFVAAVDLSERLLGRPAEQRLGTRVVLATITGESGPLLLGLIVENATETIRCDPAQIVPPAIASSDRPWLGAMIVDADGPVQLIDVDQLLASDVRRSLLAAPAEVA
jgi:chemotaxis-related protein WspB